MEKNSQKLNLKNQSNTQISQNTSTTKYENQKELLLKLLKEKLDARLCKLEKRHKNHQAIIRSTTEDIKIINDWAINANKQIKEKLKKDKDKDKEKQMSQAKRKNTIKKKDSISSKSSFLKPKTPLRTKFTKSFVLEDNKTDMSRNRNTNTNKTPTSSKTVKTLGNRTKSYSFINREKRKTNPNYNTISNKPSNNLTTVGNTTLRRPSVISNKSNKSTKSNKTSAYSKTPRSKKNSIKMTNKNGTPRKKTPLKRKNILGEKSESNHNNNSNNIQNISLTQTKDNAIKSEIIKKEEKNTKKEDINMNKMESALQKDDLLDNNDPLLIAPITDLDFYPNGKISSNNTINSDILELEKIHQFKYNIENIINDRIFNIISDFLCINDLLEFKSISKYFNVLFKKYIILVLEKDKKYFIEKKNSLDNQNIHDNLSINEFSLSKGSIKAIKLLKEPNMNSLFFEDLPPNDDRIIIYRIFFQLINHPYKYIPKDKKEEFWKKCQNFFSVEINGKAGELIQKSVDEKNIDIGGDNLYKIYKLVYKNMNKLYPSYYSNICGTTGLFTFFIKDILDFVGISNDEKIQSKAYWTYTKIIDSIENKINHMINI